VKGFVMSKRKLNTFSVRLDSRILGAIAQAYDKIGVTPRSISDLIRAICINEANRLKSAGKLNLITEEESNAILASIQVSYRIEDECFNQLVDDKVAEIQERLGSIFDDETTI
jgi:hypothetical protein